MKKQLRGYYLISNSVFWEWGSSYGKGVFDLKFAEINFGNGYSLDGFSEKSFYTAWLTKLDKVVEKSGPYDFGESIKLWAKEIVKEYTYEKKEIEDCLLQLNQDSLSNLREIVEGHNLQYEIILNNCRDFSTFLNAIYFLEDLPHRLRLIVTSLLNNQEKISISTGEINKNHIFIKGQIEADIEIVGNYQLFLF